MIDSDEQTKTFHMFLDYFGQSIAEYSNFKKSERGHKMFQRTCTISDEAYGIFTIERCWNTWWKEMEENKIAPPRTANFTNRNSNIKCGGWTKQGLCHFSNIANIVRLSRASDKRKNAEEEYRQKYIELHETEPSENNCISNHMKDTDTQNSNEDNNFTPYNDFPIHQGNTMEDTNSVMSASKYIQFYACPSSLISLLTSMLPFS